MSAITARVTSGIGKGVDFTQLDWVKDAFIKRLGIDPYPGTLNLEVDSPAALSVWQLLKNTDGYRIDGAPFGACDCRCYPISVAGRYTAAIVYPEVAGYPAQQIEVIAAIPLRHELELHDGDALHIEHSKPLKVSAVIFDVDGTLVDTIEAFWLIAKGSSGEFEHSMSREIVYRSLNEGSMFWTEVVPQDTPSRADVIERMIQEARRIAPGIMAEHGRPYDAVDATLNLLKTAGARLALVTGGESTSILHGAGLGEYFEVTITNHDVEKRKPAPDGILKCLQLLGVSAERAVYVGDSLMDVQASRAAGVASIGVLTGAGTSAALSAAGVDRMAYSHSSLPELLEII